MTKLQSELPGNPPKHIVTTKNLTYLAGLALTLSLLTACNQEKAAPQVVPSIDQMNLCEVNSWAPADVASRCKQGQKVVFLPPSFGNQQLPVIFAAVNCDLRYAVAMTTGAVTCIYEPIKPAEEAPAKPATQ